MKKNKFKQVFRYKVDPLLTQLVIWCLLLGILGITFLLLNECFHWHNSPFIMNILSIFSSCGTLLMAGVLAIEILENENNKKEANRPKLHIRTSSLGNVSINTETGKQNFNDGGYQYTFGTNLGDKPRSYQFLGICRVDDYEKIVSKSDRYGDLLFLNQKAFSCIYPLLKAPSDQPEWDYETIQPGEVTRNYKINFNEAEKSLNLKDNQEIFVLFVDSIGYLFKEKIVFKDTARPGYKIRSDGDAVKIF